VRFIAMAVLDRVACVGFRRCVTQSRRCGTCSFASLSKFIVTGMPEKRREKKQSGRARMSTCTETNAMQWRNRNE
jgi:hypothetical protein